MDSCTAFSFAEYFSGKIGLWIYKKVLEYFRIDDN